MTSSSVTNKIVTNKGTLKRDMKFGTHPKCHHKQIVTRYWVSQQLVGRVFVCLLIELPS